MVPAYALPGAVRFNDALAAGGRLTLDPVEVSGDDVAFLQYTGGTTGVSKGAVLTHRNMVANTLQVVAFMPELGEVEDPAVITALPLYHIFALTTNMLVFTHVGGNNVLITNPRDMPGFVKELAQVRFTFITGVNTLFNALLHTPGFDKLDFRSLKVALGGGMAVQARRLRAMAQGHRPAHLPGLGAHRVVPGRHGEPAARIGVQRLHRLPDSLHRDLDPR